MKPANLSSQTITRLQPAVELYTRFKNEARFKASSQKDAVFLVCDLHDDTGLTAAYTMRGQDEVDEYRQSFDPGDEPTPIMLAMANREYINEWRGNFDMPHLPPPPADGFYVLVLTNNTCAVFLTETLTRSN
jgi:hypothetical protein